MWCGCPSLFLYSIKTPERRQWYCSGVFIVSSEHISHLLSVYIVDFEQPATLLRVTLLHGYFSRFWNCINGWVSLIYCFWRNIWGLTHFWPMFPFYTPWKQQKTKGFLVFSGGIKSEHWPEMG